MKSFDKEQIVINVSLGGSTYNNSFDLNGMIKQADDNLYQAKDLGRDRYIGN